MPDSILKLLTPAEETVLALAGQGMSVKETANFLVIAQDTVKTHRKHILAKTKCRSMTHVFGVLLQEEKERNNVQPAASSVS